MTNHCLLNANLQRVNKVTQFKYRQRFFLNSIDNKSFKSFFDIFLKCMALIFIIAFHHAQAASACLPNGLSSLAPINSNGITLDKYATIDRIIYGAYVLDLLDSTKCTKNPDAQLQIYFPSTRDYPTLIPAESIVFDVNSDGTKLTFKVNFFQADGFLTTSSSAIRLSYWVYISCPGGGLSGSLDQVGLKIIVNGINSSKCDGNYSIAFEPRFQQVAGSSQYLKTSSLPATQELSSTVSFVDRTNNAVIFTKTTSWAGSGSIVYVLNRSCLYNILPSPTISFGSVSNVDIYNDTTSPKSFQIKLSNCSESTSGKSLSIYWRSSSISFFDTTILSNSSTAQIKATNVGVRITCDGTDVRLLRSINYVASLTISSPTFINCQAKLVPDGGVTSASLITPGDFTSQATIMLEFN